METRFLRTFLAVVETSSLAQASRRLGITPSAVVQRIRALEAEIGQPLIRRSGQAMRPTPAAAAILADVGRLLAAEEAVKAAASADLETGLLRVGVIHTALTGFLPDLLVELKRSRPGMELYIQPGTSDNLYADVVEGRLDVAIVVQPHFPQPKTLEWFLLRQEPLLLITPAHVEDADPFSVLQQEPLIRYDRNNWGGRIVDLYLRSLGVRPREHYELDSLEAITIMVSRGLGVALIPDWLPPWPEGVRVHRLTLPQAPLRNIGALWLKASHRLPLIKAFVQEAGRPGHAPHETGNDGLNHSHPSPGQREGSTPVGLRPGGGY
ncbi:LysR family transcriptional regulator (plasmid) [Roseomonas gilardii subsp. gilardii]|uniref:LysR family transcriptional regulator n=1 Tax=Roseomonas gilardii TaxID=257708 RepID=UPI001FF94FB3|nr:LysR family transcriptional regulator [Roseomonas gilardii]UPG74746.1 LysR family transcriptional regulator [Roseomonas gilardii subsp. gilardii]